MTATSPWPLLATLTVATAMDAVNSTVLVIAGGHLMGATHATPDEIAWVNMAYLAAKLTAFPLAAWLALRIVPFRLLLTAMLVLPLSSFGCAVTTDLFILIAWRVVQGIGGAVLLVAGQTLLLEIFPRRRQGMVQALFAFSTVMAPTTIAPALQGWAVDTLSWSWIFLANLPLGLVGLIGLLARRNTPGVARRQPPAGRFDWLGLALLGPAMICIVFVLHEGNRYDWFEEPEIVEATIVGALALALFVAWQIRAQGRGALIDLGVFRDQHFSFGFIVSFIAGCAMFGSAFLIPSFATGALDLSPTHAGLLLLPSGALV
ncbi:MAG TPA: MFS transporter, partial [Alphaproteobacteria bacterium]|nr:MFS transporter [Alphaproteobacteria bacterium]